MKNNLLNKVGFLSVFFAVFFSFILLGEGSIESDAQMSVNAAYNFVRGEGFSLSPPDYNQGIQVVKGVDGKYYGASGLMGNLIYVPGAWLSKVVHEYRHDLPKLYFPLQSDYLLTFLSSFINPIFGFLLFLVNYKIFRWFLTKKKSLLLSFIFSFSTNLLPLSKQALYHIPYLFFVMWGFYYLLKFLRTDNKLSLVWSGLIFGISILAYNMTGFLMVFVISIYLIFELVTKKDKLRTIFTKMIVFGLPMIPSLLLFFWFNYVRFYNIFNTGYDPYSYDLVTKGNLFDGVWGLLFSPGKSVFLYSPILVLSLWIAVSRFKDCIYSRLFLVLAVVYLLFYSRLVFWHGDLCWGPRYMLPIIPFAGLVLAANWAFWKRWMALPLVLFGLFVQLEGVTIAYQTQYGPYDSQIISKSIAPDRGSTFEYWGMGVHIPRYSPINKFKREVFVRWLMLKDIFSNENEIDFVSGISMPLLRFDRYMRHGQSVFTMYTFNDLEIDSLGMELSSINQPLRSITVCVDNNCATSSNVIEDKGYFVAKFKEKLKIVAGKYLVVTLNKSEKSTLNNYFEYDLYRFSVNGVDNKITSYKRVNTDSSFIGIYPVIPDYSSILTLWKIREDVQDLVNVTPDFWWVKTMIYFNLPVFFRYPFYVILCLWCLVSFMSLLYWILVKEKSENESGSGGNNTYDYYHKNTFWNDHYLIRKYMNRLSTNNDNLDWLHYVRKKYFKKNRKIKVLSVGCGNGWQDRWLAQIFDVERLDGYDISDSLLSEARLNSKDTNFHYYKADLNKDHIGNGKYDLVVNLAALHHVENMEHLMKEVTHNLKDGGYFINFDFVGPFRNQYSDYDLKQMNWMQKKLPSELVGRSLIVRPSMDIMLKEDPSEAIGSELIVPAIEKYFKVVRKKYMNGGLLYQVLYNQIQNFRQGDFEHDEILLKAIKTEEKLTLKGKVKPLFVFIVAKLRK